MMKKANNNKTFLSTTMKTVSFWVGGEPKMSDLYEEFPDLINRCLVSRDSPYPEANYFKLYHPVTGALLKPNVPMLLTMHLTIATPKPFCIYCSPGFVEPAEYWDHDYGMDTGTLSCLLDPCNYKRFDYFACVFSDEPTFSVRGLCKDAVMDIEYKFADHKPMDQSNRLPINEWGDDDTLSYVGPKGWTVSRSPYDRLWRMEHDSYKDLTLTMLDIDALPVGRHIWRIENNVCNQGETSIETLLISGCKEDQFTCDDGKCLSINQRCNNIEPCLEL